MLLGLVVLYFVMCLSCALCCCILISQLSRIVLFQTGYIVKLLVRVKGFFLQQHIFWWHNMAESAVKFRLTDCCRSVSINWAVAAFVAVSVKVTARAMDIVETAERCSWCSLWCTLQDTSRLILPPQSLTQQASSAWGRAGSDNSFDSCRSRWSAHL